MSVNKVQQKKQLRPKSIQEKESENKPQCPYDPLYLVWCNNYEFPPEPKECRECLLNRFASELSNGSTSETMRILIGYRKFMGDDKTE